MKPNILWINCDQLRWDAVGYAGNNVIQTPNIDKLAKLGACFENAYCASPVCSPARASWISGQYPHSHHQYTNYRKEDIEDGFLSESIVTLSKVLSNNGYTCGNIGVWHLGDDAKPQHGLTTPWITSSYLYGDNNDPFFSYLEKLGISNPYAIGAEGVFRYGKEFPLGVLSDVRQQRTTWTIDKTLDFLKEEHQCPFFLMTGIKDPHPPMIPPVELLSLYTSEGLPFPENFHDPLRGKPAFQSQVRCRIEPGSIKIENFRTIIRYYYALVSHIDHEIGRIISFLEQNRMINNTLLIFSSDHGEMLGNHGFLEKNLMYQESVKVPCTFSWPTQIPKQQKISTPFGGVDLAPTVLDLVGIKIPNQMEGNSFAQQLKTKKEGKINPVFAEIASGQAFDYLSKGTNRANLELKEYAAHIMVINHNWKYVWNRFDIDELYNLETDPAEMLNLANYKLNQDRIVEMQSLIVKMLENSGPGLYQWCLDYLN